MREASPSMPRVAAAAWRLHQRPEDLEWAFRWGHRAAAIMRESPYLREYMLGYTALVFTLLDPSPELERLRQDFMASSQPEEPLSPLGHILALQLVLNPNIDAGQIVTLMDAVSVQVSPQGAVFYIYGEPGRLARAVFYAYTRGGLDETVWAAWFERIANPAPLESWNAAFSNQAGLAKRHNTLEFLMAMHLNAGFAEGEQAELLDALVKQAITRVLGG